jgi:hypothetical protein
MYLPEMKMYLPEMKTSYSNKNIIDANKTSLMHVLA